MQIWLNIEAPHSSTMRDAIDRSGILKSFPTIDLETQKVGVFDKHSVPSSLVRQN
jgi:putative ubiquitin-RnfH superfamily antitoxin RatB of RatAB toxin-antitoxin module